MPWSAFTSCSCGTLLCRSITAVLLLICLLSNADVFLQESFIALARRAGRERAHFLASAMQCCCQESSTPGS
jgi:hypothetical protein